MDAFLIEGVWCWKESFRGDLVLKIIEDFNGRQILCRFNQNQIREVCQGFLDGIINYIGG